jgi:hypothetical protein
MSSQYIGLMIPNINIVGVSSRKIVAAAFHFGPNITSMVSSANIAPNKVRGMVIDATRE